MCIIVLKWQFFENQRQELFCSAKQPGISKNLLSCVSVFGIDNGIFTQTVFTTIADREGSSTTCMIK